MFLDSKGKRLFKKEKTIHEFAEEPSIKELIDMGFMKLDESKYEYDINCYCKRCKKETKARQQLQDTGITFSEENLV